jgi:hypothetical protein
MDQTDSVLGAGDTQALPTQSQVMNAPREDPVQIVMEKEEEVGTVAPASPSQPKDEHHAPAAAVLTMDASPRKATIEHVWFINLATHTKRRHFQETQLSRMGLAYSRKPAVSVETLQEVVDDPIFSRLLRNISGFAHSGLDWAKPRSPLPRKSRFVLSVCLSHLSLYDEIVAEYADDPEDRLVLVLEDDAALSANITALLPYLLDYVPPDFDVLRLGMWGEVREADRVNDFVFRAAPPFWEPKTDTLYYGGAHAVLLRTKALPRVLERLGTMQLTDLDGMLTTYPTLRSYVVDQTLGLVDVAEVDDSTNPSRLTPEMLEKRAREALSASAMESPSATSTSPSPSPSGQAPLPTASPDRRAVPPPAVVQPSSNVTDNTTSLDSVGAPR